MVSFQRLIKRKPPFCLTFQVLPFFKLYLLSLYSAIDAIDGIDERALANDKSIISYKKEEK